MAWAHIIRSSDRKLFKRCRRAWDLGSRTRQNYGLIKPMRAFDFDRAVHDALAVYYFPGMWEWNRAIVLPLALEAFFKSMRRQRDRYVEEHKLAAEEEREWNEHLDLGECMLKHYFEWAPTVDRFSSIRVETEFEVNIPDPLRPGQDLVVPEGVPGHIVPIRYRGRVDLLVLDEYNVYWIMDHRVVDDAWGNIDRLLLDEQGVSYCWALENFFLGMKVAGVIYNELRKDISHVSPMVSPSESRPSPLADTSASVGSLDTEDKKKPVAQYRGIYMKAVREPDQSIRQQGNEFFRRTQILRSRTELENQGRQLALEAMDITEPEIRLYPNPSDENCPNCAYRGPCIAMNNGSNAGSILEMLYRKRGDEKAEEGRLGNDSWGLGRGAVPPKFGP